MSRFFSKYRRNLFLLAFIPYVVLAVGAQGIHELLHSHHVHVKYSGACQSNNECAPHYSAPCGPRDNASHDAHNCLICQWVKYSPQTVQTDSTGFEVPANGFDAFYRYGILYTLHSDNNLSRAPPAVLS